MRPRTAVSPTRNVGASVNGVLKDALMSMRLSLTVGSRCRTVPASQAAADGTGATANCAKSSGDTAADRTSALEARRNSRRFAMLMVCILLRAAASSRPDHARGEGRPCSRAPVVRRPRSVDDRLIDQLLDQFAVVGADRARCLAHEHRCNLLLRVDPEVGSGIARPHELARRARHPGNPRREPHGKAEPEAVSWRAE